MAKQSAIIIGAGIGGLGTACLLAHQGWDVTVIEKNEQDGGRAGSFEAAGYTFDMGPSWYLMPEVFERFFGELGENIDDHLTLKKLSPSYRVTFKDHQQQLDIFGNVQKDAGAFESIEAGAGEQLKKYLRRSEHVYTVAMNQILYKNYDSVGDFMSPRLAKEAAKLSLLSTMSRYVQKYFKDTRLQQIMQYPLVFLGASPYNAPALYNLMSHVDFNQGVYYPMGGMYTLVEAIVGIAKKRGVKILLNAPVSKIITRRRRAVGVAMTDGRELYADVVISNADPHFTETELLAASERDHSDRYWQKRVLAPSALLMYLGVDRQYDALLHHNLLFSKDWAQNFYELFDNPQWPSDPSFYVCAPSKTDPSVAPKNHENIFVLVPLPAGLEYTQAQLNHYANNILRTMEQELDLPDLVKHIVYKRFFCVKDFENRFNSFKGTGLGLAHTLKQTAVFRPSNKSKKVKNLYYVGANVHPGIGLPVCLISAQLVSERIVKEFQ